MIIELLIGLALVWVIAWLLRQNRQLQLEADGIKAAWNESQQDWIESEKTYERRYKTEFSKRVTLEECNRLQAAEVDRLRREKDGLIERLETKQERAHETMQNIANLIFDNHGIDGKGDDSDSE